jgi:alkanesulfonate monooxygenase SsuD/methylene tetrahydromethanopterin reductase-like flavin-dependent oxidoreductase (luciferase family)
MIMRGMLHGAQPSGRSFYRTRSVRNDPPPLQKQLRILIGGAGERKTLATVARYADIWNVGGDLETIRHKDEVLRRWCKQVGRDSNEIERTLLPGIAVVRRTPAEVRETVDQIRNQNRGWEGEPNQTGGPEEVAERLAPYLTLGFRSMYFDIPAPYDVETLDLLANEVRPMLEARNRSETN